MIWPDLEGLSANCAPMAVRASGRVLKSKASSAQPTDDAQKAGRCSRGSWLYHCGTPGQPPLSEKVRAVVPVPPARENPGGAPAHPGLVVRPWISGGGGVAPARRISGTAGRE